MAKPEMDYFDTEALQWKPIDGTPGAYEKILSLDEETGSYTRLIKFEAGYEGTETMQHDFWEETYMVEGYLVDIPTGKVYSKGFYAMRPPGMKHGPFRSPVTSIHFEVRTFEPQGGSGK